MFSKTYVVHGGEAWMCTKQWMRPFSLRQFCNRNPHRSHVRRSAATSGAKLSSRSTVTASELSRWRFTERLTLLNGPLHRSRQSSWLGSTPERRDSRSSAKNRRLASGLRLSPAARALATREA